MSKRPRNKKFWWAMVGLVLALALIAVLAVACLTDLLGMEIFIVPFTLLALISVVLTGHRNWGQWKQRQQQWEKNMKHFGILAAVIGAMACSTSLMAAVAGPGNNVIQDAVTVLNGPTNTVTDVRHIPGGKSEVSVTFRSSSDEALAPITLRGVVDARLKKVYLNQVTRSNIHQGCEATIVVLEPSKSGLKSYNVPVRNILCEQTSAGSVTPNSNR